MFRHFHPYEVFVPQGATKLIIGTLPPPRFCTREFKSGDVDFCYGSIDGLLWKILDTIYGLNLLYESTAEAVRQRKDFLRKEGIGICDIVSSCYREKIDANDLGMRNIVLRDIIMQLQKHSTLHTLVFMGGNSKNGPEYFFRKQLKEYGLSLTCKEENIPRVHEFDLDERTIQTISLTSPSNAANRSIGATEHYKKQKAKNPEYSTFDFRVEQYKRVFGL